MSEFEQWQAEHPDVEVRDAASKDGPWRVWKREWVVVYGTQAVGQAGEAEIKREASKSRYADVRTRIEKAFDNPSLTPFYLQAYLPTMLGEFSWRIDAEKFVTKHVAEQTGLETDHPEIVARGSRADEALYTESRRL